MRKLFLAALVTAAGAQPSAAHGGGLDANGCHNDRQRGGYHCHQGPLAGRSFSSRADALRALSQSAPPASTNAPAAQASQVQPAGVAASQQVSPQAIAELQAAVAQLKAEVARLSELVEKLAKQLAEQESQR